MMVTSAPLSPTGPQLSTIAAGCWRLRDWGWEPDQVTEWIERNIDMGITTFDHADIYGGYGVTALLGAALRARPELRHRIQLVSKVDICLINDARPQNRVQHYDTTARHITASVDAQLSELGADHLDVLLIHRPDPLLDADEVARAFAALRGAGKVRYFGVSNFTVSQFELLASRTELVTNQVEHSLLHTAPLFDGTFDQAQRNRLRPMLWSPLGGGRLFTGTDDSTARVRSFATGLAADYGSSLATLALAWLLAEPAQPLPIVSSSRTEGIVEAAAACDVSLDRQDWFALLESALDAPVP